MVGAERGRRCARTAEYRPLSSGSRAALPVPGRSARQASTTRSAIRSAENSSARARPSTRGSGAATSGASAARQRSRSHSSQNAPSTPCSATAWIPTGVAERRHVARERLDRGQPEALVLGRDEDGVRGVDPVRDLRGRDAARAAAAGRRRPPRSARSNRFSGRDGSCGKSRYGPAGSSPSRSRASARGIGRKRSSAMPIGSTATRRRVPAPRRLRLNARETAAGSAVNGSSARVARRERRTNRSLPWSVTTTGPRRAASAGSAERPKWAWTTS